MSNKVPQALHVWYLGTPESPRLVGGVQAERGGDVSFEYSEPWQAEGFALSEDLMLRDMRYLPVTRTDRSHNAPGAIDDARPDNWGEKVIRYLYRPAGNPVMASLYFAGDERFGALGVSTSSTHYEPFLHSALPRLQDAQALSDIARIIADGDASLSDQRLRMAPSFASLGGAKPKAVIAIDDAQWVLKFFNAEPVDLPLVEHATMTLAAKAGIRVAETQIVRLGTENALAIKRFDRRGTERLHCISAGTAMRAAAADGKADFGYPQLAGVIRRSAAAKDADGQLLDLFRRMIFNILISNTDDHEKNQSFIVRNSGKTIGLELSPAYDMLPVNSGVPQHQFSIDFDSYDADLNKAMSVCRAFDLEPPVAAQEIAKTIALIDTWQSHFRSCGVATADIAELASWIDTPELVAQRRAFDSSSAARRNEKNPSRTKPGPFGF